MSADRTVGFVGSGAAVADAADTVLVGLPTPEVVREVAGELAGGGALRAYVDLSTTGPEVAADEALHVLPRTFGAGFRLELMHKDVQLCLAEPRRQEVPMALGGAVGELWARGAASAAAGADCTEIVRMLEEDAGVVVGDE